MDEDVIGEDWSATVVWDDDGVEMFEDSLSISRSAFATSADSKVLSGLHKVTGA